jgi:hypothetical protein
VPRNVDGGSLSNFGAQMAASSAKGRAGSPLPQLVFTEPEPAAMNLLSNFGNGLQRQSIDGADADAGKTQEADLSDSSSDNEVRCIPKVMQASSR